MAPPTPNDPASRPGGNHIERHHHSISATKIHPQLPQRAQRNRAASGFRPDLHRAQSLTTNVLLPITPPGPHLINIQTGLSHRAVPPNHTTSTICTRKHTELSDVVQVLLNIIQDRMSKEEAGEILDK